MGRAAQDRARPAAIIVVEARAQRGTGRVAVPGQSQDPTKDHTDGQGAAVDAHSPRRTPLARSDARGDSRQEEIAGPDFARVKAQRPGMCTRG